MSSGNPSFPLPWLAVDDDLSGVELLAVVGVIVWIGALAWVLVADFRHVRSRHREHHGEPGRRFGLPPR